MAARAMYGTTNPAKKPMKIADGFQTLIRCALTTELSGRPRCRLPHAEPANNLLATRVRTTITHGPLQRVVRQHVATVSHSLLKLGRRESATLCDDLAMKPSTTHEVAAV